MDNIWNFKEAKLIFTANLKGFEPQYEFKSLNEIKNFLNDMDSLPDFLKREIKIDTYFE